MLLAANSRAIIHTLDLPPKGHPDFVSPKADDPELDVFSDTAGISFQCTIHAERIVQLDGNSRDFDFIPYFDKMDIVFVNGAHNFDAVLRDSMNAFGLIRDQGLIVWHGYGDYAPEVVRALKTVANRFPLIHIERTSLVVYGVSFPTSAQVVRCLAREGDSH